MATISAYRQLKPDHIYRMVRSYADNELCVGCIMRTAGDVLHSRTRFPIRASSGCSMANPCLFRPEVEDWVEITEEQAMEAMLGG